VTLEPWGSGDLPLLEQLVGDPRMTEHLGGPESPDKLRERQGRYERLEGGDRMFKIVDMASGADVGSVGFWTKAWRDEQVYEVGWMSCRSSRAAASRWQRPRRRSSSPSAKASTG
jgi:RimJ/RimL family protein N-acetyltransferase